MTDLARFYIDVTRDGECSLACDSCYWDSGFDSLPDDLAGIVARAVAHRCPVVIDGTSEVMRPAIEAAR